MLRAGILPVSRPLRGACPGACFPVLRCIVPLRPVKRACNAIETLYRKEPLSSRQGHMEAYKGIQGLRNVQTLARLTGAILTGFVDVKLYPKAVLLRCMCFFLDGEASRTNPPFLHPPGIARQPPGSSRVQDAPV